MTKPDDIPQDVWDAAIEHLRRAWKAKGNAAIGASRAILAAKAEEREACLVAIRALHADAWGITEEQSALQEAIAALERRGAAIAAIRKRGGE